MFMFIYFIYMKKYIYFKTKPDFLKHSSKIKLPTDLWKFGGGRRGTRGSSTLKLWVSPGVAWGPAGKLSLPERLQLRPLAFCSQLGYGESIGAYREMWGPFSRANSEAEKPPVEGPRVLPLLILPQLQETIGDRPWKAPLVPGIKENTLPLANYLFIHSTNIYSQYTKFLGTCIITLETPQKETLAK